MATSFSRRSSYTLNPSALGVLRSQNTIWVPRVASLSFHMPLIVRAAADVFDHSPSGQAGVDEPLV